MKDAESNCGGRAGIALERQVSTTGVSTDGGVQRPALQHWARCVANCQTPSAPERVKVGETIRHADWMSACGVGSLIQASVGGFGGDGLRCL
ncbi:hypothetical protein, partial [Tsukamurella soli]|uniref:hypothetical protein n=1 Tax=Tsukamurella soli TaxID=644556 RepID=UPI0031E5899F